MKQKALIYLLMVGIGLLVGWLIFKPEKPEDAKVAEVTDGHGHGEEKTIWTCAMHPQIRQDQPGKCPICGMDLTPLEAGVDLDPAEIKLSETALKLADVQTTIVGKTLPSLAELRLTGKIKTPETAVKEIPAHFQGRIEELYVDVTGEHVSKGEVLAKVYSPELIVAQKELLIAYKNRNVNPVLYSATKSKLKNWKISDEEINRIISAGEVFNTLPIRAHHAGVVLEKNVNVGDHVSMGDVMFKIAPLGELWAEFDAYESDLAFVSLGDKIDFTVASIPGETFSGKVTFIDPLINPETRTATVRTEVLNKDKKLKPEMFATGLLEASPSKNAELTVPYSSVLWTGTGSVVYVKKPGTDGPTFEFREVKLGSRIGDFYAVKEGLQPGEEVVTKGTFTIDAAAQLNNSASMMNRDVQVIDGQVPVEEFVEESDIDFSAVAPEKFKIELNNVVNAYLKLKEGLVKGNKDLTSKYSTALLAALEKADATSLTGPAKTFWEEKKKFMIQHTKLCKEANTIEGKRENFIYLSVPLIKVVEAFGTKQTLYVNYCPMANNNKGAYWLSETPQIINPFMPETMKSCGEVKDTLK